MSPLELVREFHLKFGLLIGDRPALPSEEERDARWRLLEEEFSEWGGAEAEDDIVKVADALADMVYVIYGTALRYGIPLDDVMAEVHRSNMTKELVPGGDVLKPVQKGAGYSPPALAELLR